MTSFSLELLLAAILDWGVGGGGGWVISEPAILLPYREMVL